MVSALMRSGLLFLFFFYSVNLLAQESIKHSNKMALRYAPSKDAAIDMQSIHQWRPVFALSGGPVWATFGGTQTLALEPDIVKTYVVNSGANTLGSVEVFAGLQHVLTEQFNGQIGIAVAGSGLAKLSGDVWDDADPAFNNFSFTYNIYQVRVALKGKLIATKLKISQQLQPYLSASLGAGFNCAYDYKAIPKLFEAVPAPNFNANTTTAFSYTVGAGIQKSLTQHWQAGIGYEFADWGRSSLSRAAGQTLATGLSLGHLYTNELQFTLSFSA